MIYFSSEPVPPDSIDPVQYAALKAFKESLRKEGLIEEYQDLSEFRTKLTRQLAQTVIRRFDTGYIIVVDDAPSQAPRPTPVLTEPARELLVEATRDKGGTVMRLETLQGTHVQTNGRDFVTPGDAKDAARWRGAVDELSGLRLVEDRGRRGRTIFRHRRWLSNRGSAQTGLAFINTLVD
jgi:hypothetical protein